MKNKVLEKFSKSIYIFLEIPDEKENYVQIMQSSSSDKCVHRYNIDILNLFDQVLQLADTKLMIINRLK